MKSPCLLGSLELQMTSYLEPIRPILPHLRDPLLAVSPLGRSAVAEIASSVRTAATLAACRRATAEDAVEAAAAGASVEAVEAALVAAVAMAAVCGAWKG